MANVQVAIRFGWEPGGYALVHASFEIGVDNVADKIASLTGHCGLTVAETSGP